MSDRRHQTAEILGALYAAQRRSLLHRLGEMHNYVPADSVAEYEILRQIIARCADHEAALIDAVEDLGGTLPPVSPDVASAHLHYLDLGAILPRVIDDLRELIARYERVPLAELTPEAAELIRRIHGRKQRQLERLQEVLARLSGSQASDVVTEPSNG